MTGAVSVPIWLAVIVSTLLLPIAVFAQSNTTTLHMAYKVEWGDVDVATITADWNFSEDEFELVATSRTVGLTDTVRKYRGETHLSGRIEDGRYAPDKLNISSISKRRIRKATTIWSTETRSIATTRKPELDLEKVFPIEDEHVRGAIDPFSAMLNALAQIKKTGACGGTFRVYDGLRTSLVTLHDLGTVKLQKDRPSAFEGKALICGFVAKPTGGHQRKSRWRKKQPRPKDIQIFVAEVRPGLLVPVRIQARSFLGTVTARLEMSDPSWN